MLEGVISILEGINPRMLEAKLNGFLQQASEKRTPYSQNAADPMTTPVSINEKTVSKSMAARNGGWSPMPTL